MSAQLLLSAWILVCTTERGVISAPDKRVDGLEFLAWLDTFSLVLRSNACAAYQRPECLTEVAPPAPMRSLKPLSEEVWSLAVVSSPLRSTDAISNAVEPYL